MVRAMRKRSLPLVLVLAAFATVAAFPLACSKDAPPPVTPGPQDAGPEAAAVWTPPVQDAAPEAAPAASASALPVDMGAAVDGAIDLAIKAAAAKDAANMTQEGTSAVATVQAGQAFNQVVTLQPNRCYTIIGFSPPGQVAELELKLMAPPLYNIEAGKSGANDKAMPIIGKGKNALCPILPIPVPYRIDATAKKGGGRIGIQVFARNK
jgi:hypothetical protein